MRIALNLQPGQRLLIIGPLANGGASLEAAPLVRAHRGERLSRRRRSSRRSGATRRCSWLRFKHAPRDSFDEVLGLAAEGAGRARRGRPRGPLGLRQRSGSAARTSRPTSSARCSRRRSRMSWPFREHLAKPDELDGDRGRERRLGSEGVSGLADRRSGRALWDAIPGCAGSIARSHRRLGGAPRGARVAQRLPERRRYAALKYAGPGTDLTIGLPRGHIWVSGRSASERAFRSPRTCRPKKCSRCRTRIAWTARSRRPSH